MQSRSSLKSFLLCSFAPIGAGLAGCAAYSAPLESVAEAEPSPNAAETLLTIADFDDGAIPEFVRISNSHATVVSGEKAIDGQSMMVTWKNGSNYSTGMTLAPDSPWDWSAYSDFSVVFDVKNPSDESVEINVTMSDNKGGSYTRVFVIAAGDEMTVYGKMDGHDQYHPPGSPANEFNFQSGLRANPPSWQREGEYQLINLWGPRQIDYSAVTGIHFGSSGKLTDRSLVIDNIRLRANPPKDPNFLVGLLDEFGQNAKMDYPGKVKSEEQLRAEADAERAALKGDPWPGRSKFHGWADGPRFEATGYFHPKKVDGKWWLIDPEGYLYFSSGVDIIRLSNSGTMTGYDFDHSYIDPIDPNSLIQEDDQPLNPAPVEAWPTRGLVNQMRSEMFTWLPDIDHPLGNHYGYRRTAQSGPLKRGETFSFYSANLERRYGETYPKSYMDTWREVSLNRLVDWGFTSLGNWVEPEFYDNQQMPFVAFADINGEFKTVSSGFDFWFPVPDPFDPFFYERAVASAEFVKEQMKGSPWCMGIFYDNEQSFGRAESDTLYFGVVLNALGSDAAESPAKAHFTQMLKDKYSTIDALNAAWAKDYDSWETFAAGINPEFTTPDQRQDFSDMLYAFGKQYFSTIERATKSVLPNHMYLGARMADWGRPDEIVRAAAEHSDVLSFNIYHDGIVDGRWDILKEVDRPALVGEFMFGASDRGHFHPGIVVAADQKDRGVKYGQYLQTVLDNPYFVGAHYFQYMDSPITGRALDGENYNNGVVDVTDRPYYEQLEGIMKAQSEIYTRRYNGQK